MKTRSPYLIKPRHKVRLDALRTTPPAGFINKAKLNGILDQQRLQLDKTQELFYAARKKALLVVLQGMDTAGKDGTTRHIFSGMNPQGCQVTSFKVPTPVEMSHDFLWRVHAQVPPRGMIGIFNRSHYEDVLSPRVHKLISPKKAHQHMDDINGFESFLVDNDVIILKFFLHISKAEQKRRLQSRIDDPSKYWKLEEGDFHERLSWDTYQEAYGDILTRTSKSHAPWFVIPADDKHYRNVAISEILVNVLQSLKLKYPKPAFDPKTVKL